jgi:molybdate transport system substrate-binding protein
MMRSLCQSLAAIVVALSGATAGAAQSETVLVFAAASAAPAIRAIADPFTARTGISVTVSGAATSTLAQQIVRGAPAQLVLTAHPRWMTHLSDSRAIDATRRTTLLGNELVLIAPLDGATTLEPSFGFALEAALGRDGRLAIGDPTHVPAGIYARQALTTLGVWASVADRLAPAGNVVAAVTFVARGESPLGIAYRTDAALSDGVRVVGLFPASSHDPVRYDLAPVSANMTPAADAFLNHLRSDAARTVFERYGFRVMAAS